MKDWLPLWQSLIAAVSVLVGVYLTQAKSRKNDLEKYKRSLRPELIRFVELTYHYRKLHLQSANLANLSASAGMRLQDSHYDVDATTFENDPGFKRARERIVHYRKEWEGAYKNTIDYRSKIADLDASIFSKLSEISALHKDNEVKKHCNAVQVTIEDQSKFNSFRNYNTLTSEELDNAHRSFDGDIYTRQIEIRNEGKLLIKYIYDHF